MTEKSITLPQLSFPKVIRDYIHDYIPLTMIEYKLLQLPVLNRLHNIRQLGSAYMIYPCAKGSRFEHSLGVMQIASQMIYQLLWHASPEELNALFDLKVNAPTQFKKGCRKLIQKIRLAALFHDIGHGPFSHLTENIMLDTLTAEEVNEAKQLFNCEKKHIPSHEYFSFKMITSDQSEIKKIIDNSTDFKAEDIANLLIGKASNSLSEQGVKILKKLISSQLDADRMDYLLRDAYESGVIFGQTDIERVVMNLRLRKDKQGRYELAVHERALMNIEDIMDARFKMYKWLYNHHLIVAFDILLEQAIKSLIDDKILDKKDFHWKSFIEGKTDEAMIFDKLKQYPKSQFKGLIDRRYAPTSLLKRPGDHKNLLKMIGEKAPRKISEDAIVNKTENWFDELETGKINVIIPKGLEKLEKMKFLAIRMPRSPYRELNGNDNVWICTDKDDELKELTTESNYIKAINEEWRVFPSFYLSFLIPNMKKTDTKQYKEKVLEIVAEQIASF